jgi:hypothetical protein
MLCVDNVTVEAIFDDRFHVALQERALIVT